MPPYGGHGAAAQAGPRAAGDERDALAMAQLDDTLDLFSIRRGERPRSERRGSWSGRRIRRCAARDARSALRRSRPALRRFSRKSGDKGHAAKKGARTTVQGRRVARAARSCKFKTRAGRPCHLSGRPTLLVYILGRRNRTTTRETGLSLARIVSNAARTSTTFR